MKHHLLTAITLGLLSVLPTNAEEGFTLLFDGKSLEGWQAAKSTGKGDFGAFSINSEEQAIQIYAGQKAGSKQDNDCLVTTKQFSHYILKLEYKWLEKRFAPRTDWDRDAGLLYHIHGDLKKVWPLSLEMQIGESPGDKEEKGRRFHTGDLFVLGKGLSVEVPRKGQYYDPQGERKAGQSVPTRLGVEKPKGEWNEIEIRVDGAKKATYLINGEVVFELFDMLQRDTEGKASPLEKGHIGLQAEWAELLYRNIRIKELPAE